MVSCCCGCHHCLRIQWKLCTDVQQPAGADARRLRARRPVRRADAPAGAGDERGARRQPSSSTTGASNNGVVGHGDRLDGADRRPQLRRRQQRHACGQRNALYRKLPYDPVRDFIPVSAVLDHRHGGGRQRAPARHTRSRISMRTRKAQTGGLNIAIPAPPANSPATRCGSRSAIKMTNVQYKGSAPSKLASGIGRSRHLDADAAGRRSTYLRRARIKAYGITEHDALAGAARRADARRAGRRPATTSSSGTGCSRRRKRRDAAVRAAYKAVVRRCRRRKCSERFRQLGLVIGRQHAGGIPRQS